MLVFIPPFAHSSLCMLQGNFDTTTWFFHVKMWWPFETKSIAGWYFRWGCYSLNGYSYVYMCVTVITWLVECCLYIKALCQNFQIIIDDCDEIVNTKYNNMTQKQEILLRRELEWILKKNLCRAMAFREKILK